MANGSGDALEDPLDNRIVLIAFGQPEDVDGSEVGRDFNDGDLKIERIYRSKTKTKFAQLRRQPEARSR